MQRQPAVSQKREAEIMSRLARIAAGIARIRRDEIREDSSVRQIRPHAQAEALAPNQYPAIGDAAEIVAGTQDDASLIRDGSGTLTVMLALEGLARALPSMS